MNPKIQGIILNHRRAINSGEVMDDSLDISYSNSAFQVHQREHGMSKQLKQATPSQIKALKIALCIFGAVLLFVFIMALPSWIPKDMTIQEYKKNKGKLYNHTIDLTGTVSSTSPSAQSEVFRGDKKLKSFVLEDESGNIRIYYDPDDLTAPNKGDYVNVRTESTLVIMMSRKTTKLLATSIELE